MTEYPKINAPFHRDMSKPGHPLIIGRWSEPEFEYLQSNEFEWTEKVDGTNIRIELRKEDQRVYVNHLGRTDNANIPPNLAAALHELFPDPTREHTYYTPEKSKRMDLIWDWMVANDLTNVVLYGEGYGPKIQGGGKYREDASFVLFDVKVGDFWLSRENVNDVGAKLGVDTVPVVGYGSLPEAIDRVRSGLESMWGEFEAEGLVVRPNVPLFNRKGQRITTKIKSRDFR